MDVKPPPKLPEVQSGESLETSPLLTVQPTTDGRAAQAYVESTLDPASLEPSAQPVIVEEQPLGPQVNKSLSLFRYNKIALFTTLSALVAFALIGGGSWFLSAHKANKQDNNSRAAQINNYNVSSLDLKEVNGAQQLQVKSAEYLTINGQLQVGNTLVLAPMSGAPSAPTTGQIYYDKATNQPYYYDGTKFISLAPQDIPKQQTIGAFVGTLQGQSGNLTLAAGSGIGISGLKVSNTGVTGLHGTTGVIDVSNTSGDVTLSLPGLVPTAVVATDSSGHLTSLTAVTPGLCLISTAGGPAFGSCTGSAQVTSVNSLSGALTIAAGSGISVASNGTDTLTIASTASGVASLNGATGALTIANATQASGIITVQDATAAQKGLASFNGSDFSVASGAVSLASAVTKQGNSFNGSAQLIKLDVGGQASSAGQCLLSTAGGTAFASCPVGGNVSRGGAVTTNTIAKFDASGNIINSNISDSGALVTISAGNFNISAGALQLGGTTVITNGRVLQNVTADTSILTSGTLGVNRGGTGQSTFTDGQLLIGNSVGNTLTKATLTAGAGVSIANGNGSIIISAPSAGSCSSCAATSLNNLAAVAINTSLLSGNATIDLGSNANPFRDLFLGGTATNNFRFTGVASAARTITVPDASGTLAVSASGNIALSAGGNVSFTGTLPVLNGGTGQTTFTDGQLLIGNSTGNTLTKATLTAGAGVTITNGGGAITIAAPAAGSCSTCANTALSNLTGVAINTSLLTGSSAIDLGSSANPFRDLYLGGTSTNNFKFTGTASVARTLTVPDASGTLAVSASGNIALSGSGNITFTGQLPITNGGTGASTAAGALANLGAAASGANSDITSLSGLTSINPGAALTIGNTGQSLTLQGSGATTLTATSGGFTTIVGFATPTANVTYSFAAASAGAYDVCTTAGNCVGAGGGVTTSGGTTNKLAKFTGSSAIGDSGISDNGTTVNIQGTGGLDIGTSSIAGILDLEAGGGFHTRLQSGTLSGNLTFTLPTSNGSSGNCLTTNGSGTLSFSPCLSGSGAGGGVTDINGTSGSITLQSVVNQTTLSGSSTISIGTVQDIATSSSPTFAGLNVTSTSGITLGTGANLGKAIFRDGSSAFSVTLQTATISGSNKTITIPGATGTICLQSDPACGFQPAGSYAASGANSDITSLSGLTTALAVSEGGTGQSTFTDGQLLIGNSVGNTLTKTTLTAGSGISITNGNGSITIATTGGSGVTGSGTNNTIAKFNGTGSAITDSGLTDNGATLGYTGNVNFSGATSTFDTGNGAVSLNGNTTVTGSNTFTVNNGLTTLSGGATINGTTSINATGTSNTTIGNGTGTFAVSSATLNISTAGAITGVTTLNLSGAISGATVGNTINGLVINSGALSGVTGITTNGGYTQSGTTANTFTGATTFSAAGTALSVTNNATIGGTLGVGSSSQLQVDASGNFTTTGSGTIQSASGLTIGANSTQGSLVLYDGAVTGKTATLKVATGLAANSVISFPSAVGVSDTVCLLTLANCAGAGGGVTSTGGTQNYITKFSNAGATQIGNSLLYDNGSFVGLNTTTNSGTLSVVSGGTQAGLFVQGAGSGTSSQVVIKNGGSSGDALQIQDSGGAPLLKVAATGELTLNTLGSSAVTLLCINGSNQIATCAPTAGTNSFILNGTSTQTANFNIQSALPGSIGGIIQGAVSQAANLLEFKNSGGSLLSEVTSTGAFQGGNATGTDVAGSALSLNGGQGTGTGNGGNILFKIFKAAGSTGSTNNTTASTVLTLSGTDGSALFKNATDSAKGFQVQSTSGVDILTVDTANGKFGTANQTTGSTNSNNVVLQSGNATGVTSNSGSVTIDSGTATGTAGNISIGTGAYTHNTTIGNSTGTSAITLQSGTSGITASSTATTGNAFTIQGNSLTTGNGLNVTTSAITTAGSLAAISSSGTFTNIAGGSSSSNILNVSRSNTVNVSLATNPTFESAAGGSTAVANPMTWNHTVGANGNRLLVVNFVINGITGSNCFGSNTVTYGGVAMTQLGSQNDGVRQGFIYYLKNPASGTAAVSITFSGACTIQSGFSASFYNIDQTTTFRTLATNFTSNLYPISINATTLAGDLVLDMNSEASTTAPTAGGGQTSMLNLSNGVRRSFGSYQTAIGTTTSFSWTGGGGATSQFAVGLIPASAPPNLAITGAVATFSNSCTATSGTCTDSSNILNLNQQYTSASGSVLAIQNAGTGADLQLGSGIIRPASDSTTAIKIQNAAGTGNNALVVDTTNRRVGINLAGAPSQALDVGGNVNVSTGSAYMINGVSINTAGTLSNVAYLNQANSFNVAGTNTFTGTAAGSSTLAVVSSQTTANALSVTANSLTSGSALAVTGSTTTGTLASITANSLTTGNGLSVSSTSANLALGDLVSINQSSSYTVSTGPSNTLLDVTRSITSNVSGSGVQFDNSGVDLTHVSSSSNSWTKSYTVGSGGNRLLLVAVETTNTGSSNPVTGITYAGTAMTFLNDTVSHPFNNYHLTTYYLVAPASNANNVVVSFSGSLFGRMFITSWSGVDQSTPLGTPVTAFSTFNGQNYSLTPVSSNSDVVTDFIAGDGAYGTAGGSQTVRLNSSGPIATSAPGQTGTTTMTRTNVTSNDSEMIAFALHPASSNPVGISGSLVSFSSTCIQSLSTCGDNSNILNLNQQYASATGAVLALQNAGTGADIQLGGGTIKTADGTTTTAVNLLSGNASGGASGAVAIKSGSGTTSSGTVTIQSGNASAGTAGNVIIDVGTSTSGGGTVNIGGTNATGVFLARSGVAVTVAGTLQTAAIASSFTTSNALTLQSGNNTGVSLANTGSVTLKSGDASAGTSGNVTVDSGAATSTAGNVSIGTGAYSHNVTVGNTTGTSGVTLQGGSAGVTISGSQTTTNTLNVSNTQTVASTVTQSGNVANISRVNSVGGTITQDGSTVSNSGASSTLSITITDHGDNKRLLLVTSTCGLTPSFNGSSLTQLSGTGATLCFYYLKNPSIGTFNITGLSGSGGFSQFASSWYNIDQTNPIDSGASNANLSITASPTTTSDKVADYISSSTLTNSPGSGQTGSTLANFFASATYGFSTKTGTASTTTMSWGAGSSPTHIVAVMHPSTGALTVSGAAASISSNCTISGGTCTDTSNILNLNQQYASATGAVLALQNAGTGADIQLGTGLIQTAAGTTSNTITLQSGNASAGASGNIVIDTGTFTSGTPTVSIGTTNASAVSIGRSGQLATFNGNVSVAAGGYISLVGGITSSRPASPTEGMLYYDTTTKKLLVYSNGKWQADRSTATKIVADGSTSLGADGADYVVPAAGTSAQTTINSAITSLGSTGGTVYLMEGTYTVDGSITIPSNVSLVGAGSGTVIKVKSSLNVSIDVIVDDTGVQNRIMVSNLKLDGNKTNNSAGTQNGINFSTVGSGTGSSAVPGGTIDKVWVENFRNAGMVFGTSVNLVSNTIVSNSYSLANSGNGFTFGNNTNYNRVEHSVSQGNGGDGINSGGSQLNASDNQIQNNTGSGISFGSGSYNTVSGNTIVGNSGNGVDMTVSGHNNVTGNTVKSNSGQGLRAQSSGDNNFSGNTISLNGEGVRTQSASNNTISANTIEGNTGDGIEIAGSSSENISGNTVEGNGSHGIEISTGGSKIAVTGNSIGNNSGNGLNLSQSGGNNHINGNRFYDNGGSGGTSTINVPLLGGNFNVISNNTITDSAGTAYAIDIASSIPTGTYLSGNVFSGVGASKIHDTGTGTIYENQLNSNGDIVLKNNTGGLAVGTSSATNSFTLQGSIKTSQLSPPTNVSVTKQGTAGAVTYYYEVTALDGNGETLPSSNANLTNSNATLDTTNYNKVSFTPVPGAVQYKVYRATASGGPYALTTNGTITLTSPASQVSWDPTSDTLTFFDQSNTTSGAISSINTTGISLFGYNVGIGTSSAPNLLNVGTLTTAATGYQVAISTGGTGNSGLVIQGVAGQSSGYMFQAQDSTGATLASIDYQGNLVVKSATINGTLTVNGHIVTGNTSGSTTASPHANAGTSATCTISGNDTGGQITLVTGSGSWAAGTQCTITFASSFVSAPHPVIVVANGAGATTNVTTVNPYVDATTTTMTLNFTAADSAAHTYYFNYFVAQ